MEPALSSAPTGAPETHHVLRDGTLVAVLRTHESGGTFTVVAELREETGNDNAVRDNRVRGSERYGIAVFPTARRIVFTSPVARDPGPPWRPSGMSGMSSGRSSSGAGMRSGGMSSGPSSSRGMSAGGGGRGPGIGSARGRN